MAPQLPVEGPWSWWELRRGTILKDLDPSDSRDLAHSGCCAAGRCAYSAKMDNPEDLEAWEKTPGVQKRQKQLAKAFEHFKAARHLPDSYQFVGVRYVMLHSLSHLLLTAVSLECGYSSSSITERVYSTPGGSGILLFTGTPDSEGTLGGLVEVGRHLDRHLDSALEMGALCSNDPVCAAHEPLNDKEKRHLHGAACHGCLLISETSCEQMNQFLDSALVVPTVDCADAAFFPAPG